MGMLVSGRSNMAAGYKMVGKLAQLYVLEAIRDSASPKLQRYWELAPKVLFTSLRLACLLHSG